VGGERVVSANARDGSRKRLREKKKILVKYASKLAGTGSSSAGTKEGKGENELPDTKLWLASTIRHKVSF